MTTAEPPKDAAANTGAARGQPSSPLPGPAAGADPMDYPGMMATGYAALFAGPPAVAHWVARGCRPGLRELIHRHRTVYVRVGMIAYVLAIAAIWSLLLVSPPT